MPSPNIQAKIDAKGKLNIQLLQELANREIDLVIVYQLVTEKKTDDIHEAVDRFYGCLESDPILLNEQFHAETV